MKLFSASFIHCTSLSNLYEKLNESLKGHYRYIPILPLVLINGAEGIGTGWSTFIPNFNPRDIVENVRRLLTGEQMVAMQPWYKNFTGLIEETASKTSGKSYTCNGVISKVLISSLKHTAYSSQSLPAKAC